VKWLGYRQLAGKSIKRPGDIAARMKEPRVVELADSIRHLGEEPIHAPTVDEAGALIAGRDRMAALLNLKAKRIWVRVAGGLTEQERLDLEVDENLRRRVENRDELIARKVQRLVTAALTQGEGGRNVRLGRQAATAAARKKVAAQLDTTTEAVRAAEKRARQESAREERRPSAATPIAEADDGAEDVGAPVPAPVEALPSSPPVRAWGVVPIGHVEALELQEVQDRCDQIDKLLRQAQAIATGCRIASPVAQAAMARAKAAAHAAAAEVRACRPDVECPFCKRVPCRLAACGACGGTGYLTEQQIFGVDDRMLIGGDGAVVPDGRGGMVPASGALAIGAPPRTGLGGRELPKFAKPAAKKLRIEDPDGNALEPVEDTNGVPW